MFGSNLATSKFFNSNLPADRMPIPIIFHFIVTLARLY